MAELGGVTRRILGKADWSKFACVSLITAGLNGASEAKRKVKTVPRWNKDASEAVKQK